MIEVEIEEYIDDDPYIATCRGRDEYICRLSQLTNPDTKSCANSMRISHVLSNNTV